MYRHNDFAMHMNNFLKPQNYLKYGNYLKKKMASEMRQLSEIYACKKEHEFFKHPVNNC